MDELYDVGAIEDYDEATDHVIIRLVTGDEVIGKLDIAGPHTIVLADPVLVYVVNDDNGIYTSFSKFSNFSKDDVIPFNRNLVIAEYTPSKALIKRYDRAWEITKAAKTGIELADEQKSSIYKRVLENSSVEHGVKN